MEKSFWTKRWSEGRIGFHLSEINPCLVRNWGTAVECGNPRSGARVLVPLCGKSVDLLWLTQQGLDVVGVEFVESAAETFAKENDLAVSRRVVGDAVCYSGRVGQQTLELWVADFFALSTHHFAACSHWYDRAALVALEPATRKRYVNQVMQLTTQDAIGLLVNFEHDMGSGPPFSVPAAEVKELFSPHALLNKVEETDILGAESRFRERGATFMLQQAWSLQRR